MTDIGRSWVHSTVLVADDPPYGYTRSVRTGFVVTSDSDNRKQAAFCCQ